MQTLKSPKSQTSNVIWGIDFRTITALRSSIKEAKAKFSDDFRFQKGIEKEEELLKLFMSKRNG